MKTLVRILIILTAFAAVMSIVYVAVNFKSASTSTTGPVFENRGEGLAPNGARSEFNGESPGAGSWIFGMTKNTVIIAAIVALVVLPKSVMRKRRRTVPVRIR